MPKSTRRRVTYYQDGDQPMKARDNPYYFEQADLEEFLGDNPAEVRDRLGMTQSDFDQTCREVEEIEKAVRRRNEIMSYIDSGTLGVRVGRLAGRSTEITPKHRQKAEPVGKRYF